MNTPRQQIITARLVKGRGLASGLNGNLRFPGGTLRMPVPLFFSPGT